MIEPVQSEARENTKDAPAQYPSARRWHMELTAAHAREIDFRRRARALERRFRDEQSSDEGASGDTSKVNIFYANTEILKSSVYGKASSPDIRRRFTNKDPVAREASLLLERAVSYCLERYAFDAEIKDSVLDGLIAGRGQAWVVYTPELDPAQGGDGEDGEAYEEITSQKAEVEYCSWEDFRMSAGKRWAHVWWVGRRHSMKREELKELNSELADKVPMGYVTGVNEEHTKEEDGDDFKRAEVWEIWDKSRQQRVWVVEGFRFILRIDEDPYDLENFYPCPRPLQFAGTPNSLIPLAPFTRYQDQARELDLINGRIFKLIDQLKYKGLFPEGGDNEGALSKLQTANDGQFFGVKNFAAMAERGGLKGMLETVDLAPIITTISSLYTQRQQIIETIFQISGISDIMRGQVNPNEKLGQSSLKAQFGSLRLEDMKDEVNRFVLDIIRIKAEIIAEHFQPDILMDMTGLQYPDEYAADYGGAPEAGLNYLYAHPAVGDPSEFSAEPYSQVGPQSAEAAPQVPQAPQTPPVPEVTIDEIIEVLRSDRLRGYKINIETAATALEDTQQQKAERLEFVSTMQNLLSEGIPAMQANPTIAPLIKEMVMFAARGFKMSRHLEDALEDAFEKIQAMPRQEPPPDTTEQDKLALELQKHQDDVRLKQAEIQQDGALRAQSQQTEQVLAQAELIKKQSEIQNGDNFTIGA